MLLTGSAIKYENTPTIPNLIRNPGVRVAGFSGVQWIKEIDSGLSPEWASRENTWSKWKAY
jgi:hypothetical protein